MGFAEETKMETLHLPTVGEESNDDSFRTDPEASFFMKDPNPIKMEQIDEDDDENRETLLEEMKESVSPLPVAIKTQVSEPSQLKAPVTPAPMPRKTTMPAPTKLDVPKPQ